MTRPLMQHGGQLRELSERFGIDPATLLDFSANINPDGPPASVTSMLRAALLKPATLGDYPDLEEVSLRESLATYVGITAKNVVVANGFVPILSATLQALRLRKCVLPVPAFNEYRKSLEQQRVEVETVVLQPSLGFQYDFESLLGRDGDAFLLANPQNPTGALAKLADLVGFVEECSRRSRYVLLDEAFIDYTMQDTLSGLVAQYTNLIVFRSLTKFFGMPGLRVAYALACSGQQEKISDLLPPWSVSTLASIAAIEAVRSADYIERGSTQNSLRRRELAVGLEARGLKVFPGQANYLLFQAPNAKQLWRELISRHRVVLRLCDGYECLPDGFLRTAIRNEQDNSVLLSSLAKQFGLRG